MKNLLKNVSFVFLLFKMCIILGQEVSIQKRIIIDVGHGGKVSGAIGLNGIQEKDVVLNIANAILKLNKKSDTPLDIYLTRYTDTLISLSDRSNLAKALEADLFLSLHCNHSDNPDARGVEVYVAERESRYQHTSIWLAFQLQAKLNSELGLESRGVKFGNFQVLQKTTDFVPGVLLELGFLSNGNERDYLLKAKSVTALALVIWECLIKNIDGYERVGD